MGHVGGEHDRLARLDPVGLAVDLDLGGPVDDLEDRLVGAECSVRRWVSSKAKTVTVPDSSSTGVRLTMAPAW